MNSIKCQLCMGVKGEDGCDGCGGYGVVAFQSTLDCGCVVWNRPGAYTSYIGKKYRSMDGLEIEVTKNGDRCTRCLSKESGPIEGEIK